MGNLIPDKSIRGDYMKTGRVISIKASWVKDIDIGSVKDEESGEIYPFNAPKDQFLRNEKVIFGPIEGTELNKGDVVLLNKV